MVDSKIIHDLRMFNDHGIKCGHFLTAMINKDYDKAWAYADSNNKANFKDIQAYVNNPISLLNIITASVLGR
tara:strand:- start:200 stop:415 length:216 start_codon:yes stop_codon:yes gene_type:complete